MSVNIITVGDIAGSGGSMAKTADLTRTLMKEKPIAGILLLGDNAYDEGTMAEYTKFFEPSWGQTDLVSLMYPSPGNHEYGSSGAAGYFSYFKSKGRMTGDAGKGYYSFDLGGWHILSVNTNDECGAVACGATSAQVTWIKTELAANKDRCTIAYMHHQMYNQSSGGHPDSEQAFMKDIWNALVDGGLDLALSGHNHCFQQLGPMDKAGKKDVAKGVRSFVVGTGGIDLYAGFNKDHADTDEFKQDNQYGVLEVTLDPTAFSWRYVAVGGKVLTSGNDKCH